MADETEKKDSGTSFLSRLKFLVHPIAMGIYLTVIFSTASFFYYLQSDFDDSKSIVMRLLNDMDQKSIDYRLRLRGPRQGSPDVAVLAFDDRSLDVVGRWPWPRQTTSQVFKNAIDAGAKVIAADIVWSEPTDRPELFLAQKMKEESLVSPSAAETLDLELDKLDGDKRFASDLEVYGDKFVLGNIFIDQEVASDNHRGYGYIDACHDMVFKQTPTFSMFDSDEEPLAVLDSNDMFLPETIRELYTSVLLAIDEQERASFEGPMTPQSRARLDSNIERAKSLYCENAFLNKEGEEEFLKRFGYDLPNAYELISENWAALQEADPDLMAATFDEWTLNFKATSLANRVLVGKNWTTNISKLYEPAKYHGYFNALLESDGTIRRSQLVVRSGNTYMPSIALKGYLVATGNTALLSVDPLASIPGLKGLTSVMINNSEGEELFSIPIRNDGSIFINYAGDQKMFPYVSAAELADPNQEKILISQRYYDQNTGDWVITGEYKEVDKREFLKGKMLVAGATAIGVYDLRLSPFGENFPGVETHANVLDNLVRQDFLRNHKNEAAAMPLILLALGLIITLALGNLGAVSGLIFAGVAAAITMLIEKHFFFLNGYVISIIFPLLLIFSNYVFMTFYKYFTEERAKKELRQTFSKYVSPAIVAEVLEDPKNLELGGRKEEITIFFSDVKGFTSISEKLDPRALSDLLNDYLTPMTDLVFENKGTLDKYIGDAVMAFFGAPIHYEDHAKYAARCALQQLEKLSELQEKYAKKGLPMIDIRIGLNTGECSVGNMGSETVRNYTVMGDAVNLASRLEAINNYYSTRIMVSEFTEKAIRDDFMCREVDWVRVKGKLLPVKIFELIAEGRPSDSIDQMKKYFDDGYSLYHEKRFEAAIQAFEKASQANPQDGTSQIYIDRCRTYLENPPPDDWDGVFVMTTK